MKSVVVCGSKRYEKEIAMYCKELEKLGVLVFEPDFRPGIAEGDQIKNDLVTQKIFTGLTLEHFNWIRKADVCFVFNNGDYAGVSVAMEMAYACALGKPVFAMSAKTGDLCRDALIDKVVKSPKELTALL